MHDERDVAIVDLPKAFIQTKFENEKDRVTIILRVKLAEYLVILPSKRLIPICGYSKRKESSILSSTNRNLWNIESIIVIL